VRAGSTVLLTVSVVLLFTVAACSRKSEVGEIKRVISRYNELLIWGYRNLNMNPLQEVATEEQAAKLYHHMAALGEGDARMESVLKKIDFREITFEGRNAATVKTQEIWDFAHYGIKTGDKQIEEKDFVYELTYHLKKEDRKWLVEKVTVIETSDAAVDKPLAGPSGKDRRGQRTPKGEKK